MSLIQRVLLAAVLAGPVCLAACSGLDAGSGKTPSIDIRPSAAVRYATERVSPAVVQLGVVTEDFVGGQPRSSRSIGSGVIIDQQGHVLTNFHVAGRAKRIEITLASQEHVSAKLVGSDHWTDLALVQLDMAEVQRKGLTFHTAQLGDSSEITLGQPVMAVGTPYGLSRTLTAGIVSNTDRSLEEMTMSGGYETGWFNNWIQTDAAINPGNSGGPLIDLRGDVVGINARGFSDANNLGFAIPISTAKEIVAELLAHGKVTRSYIGVQLQPMQDLEGHYDIEGNKGVLIASVEKDSPAMLAGIKAEDILLAVNGHTVNARFPEQLAAVRKLISDFPVGSKLEIAVGQRARSTSTMPATTAPGVAATRRMESTLVAVTTDKLESVVTEQKLITSWGLSVRDLTRAYLREHTLPKMEGVLVTGVQSGSLADRAAIRQNDIITSIDGKRVVSTDELDAAVDDWSKKPRKIFVIIFQGRSAGQQRVLEP